MLQLTGASLRRGPKLLFEDANLQIHHGQRLGLIGVNGSGKSSLFALILGELETDEGSIQVNRNDLIAHVSQQSPAGTGSAVDFVVDGDREYRQLQAGLAELDPGDPSPEVQSVLHELHERMDNIGGYTAYTRAAILLSGLGFPDTEMEKPVDEFSGGWRMRLNLAQALMCRSDILLLDEPTNHLDLPAILWLERWLKSYEGILLVISHDRDFLDSLCTHTAHIEHQAVKLYSGNYSQFERIRSEQLALQQAMYTRQQKEISHIQSYVDRFRYKASKARQAQSRLKMLERMPVIAAAHVDSQFHFNFLDSGRLPQHLLSLENVDAGYDRVIVGGVNLSIEAGSRLGLLGVNGAGKSTLLKTLVDGSTLLSGERTVHRHTRIGYFAQHQLELLRMDCSPLWHVRQQSPDLPEQQLRNHLGRFGFRGERVDEPVEPFSGGEKARLVLAVLILQKPNLLLLDEPTNHLDLDMRQALSMALVEYSGALLVISHDRHLLRSVCDELFIVHDGRLSAFGGDLEEYSAWLKDQSSPNLTAEHMDSRPQNKKEQRQLQAQRRQQLQPQVNKVREIEQLMSQYRATLEAVVGQLADENLYSDSTRRDELAQLLQKQGQISKELESLEWRWLEASEALESAQSGLD